MSDNPQYWSRFIAFVDMDAFFASIEQLDHPEYQGKPIGITNGQIGTCLITCSVEPATLTTPLAVPGQQFHKSRLWNRFTLLYNPVIDDLKNGRLTCIQASESQRH